MTFQGQVWNNVDFALDLNGGRLQISPLTLSLPDGQLRMSMSVDASRDTVPVTWRCMPRVSRSPSSRVMQGCPVRWLGPSGSMRCSTQPG